MSTISTLKRSLPLGNATPSRPAKKPKKHYYADDLVHLNFRLSDMEKEWTPEDDEALDQAIRVIDRSTTCCHKDIALPAGCDALYNGSDYFNGQVAMMTAVFHLCYIRDLRKIRRQDKNKQ